VRARKRFGQHFLEVAWVAKLVDAIDPQPDQAFLEIGAGHGALTEPLASRAARVVAIEIDRDLVAGLRARAVPRVEIVEADILEVELEALALPRGTRVTGNLPYNISSPILTQLVTLQRATGKLHDATLMLQREVVDRIVAKPGTRDYGPLAILLGLVATVERLMILPPGAFRPAPKVTSAVVRLTFHSEDTLRALPRSLDVLVRRAFTKRRKTLTNALRPVLDAQSGEDVRVVLERAGLEGGRRPETLLPSDWVRLADAIGSTPPNGVS
jgi:16S rRNA (adenine1518-N6/adenine1519-N6)-dimethyltransferase